MQASTSRYVT